MKDLVTHPVSKYWGNDRGKPIDRYYIEKFLQRYRALITGSVLEVGNRKYTRAYGNNVTRSEVLNLVPARAATIIGNLETGEQIPESQFDCIILTQVIQFIYDVRAAIGNAMKALKPGGVLLVTVSGVSKNDNVESYKDYWRFTQYSLRRLLQEFVPEQGANVESYGNIAVAKAFLDGYALHEIPNEVLEYRDPDFEVVITGIAVKKANRLVE